MKTDTQKTALQAEPKFTDSAVQVDPLKWDQLHLSDRNLHNQHVPDIYCPDQHYQLEFLHKTKEKPFHNFKKLFKPVANQSTEMKTISSNSPQDEVSPSFICFRGLPFKKIEILTIGKS
jgi:hypothetical protein